MNDVPSHIYTKEENDGYVDIKPPVEQKSESSESEDINAFLFNSENESSNSDFELDKDNVSENMTIEKVDVIMEIEENNVESEDEHSSQLDSIGMPLPRRQSEEQIN